MAATETGSNTISVSILGITRLPVVLATSSLNCMSDIENMDVGVVNFVSSCPMR